MPYPISLEPYSHDGCCMSQFARELEMRGINVHLRVGISAVRISLFDPRLVTHI